MKRQGDDEIPRERLSRRGTEVVVEGVNLSRDFACHGCGNCCRGDGYVQLTRREEVEIAEYLNIGLRKFREKYCQPEGRSSFILIDHPGSDACIFLDEETNRCKIHVVKPQQCAEFPYRWRADDFTKTCAGFLALKKNS